MKKLFVPLVVFLSLFCILYCATAILIIFSIDSSAIYVACTTLLLLIIQMTFILFFTLRKVFQKTNKCQQNTPFERVYSLDENTQQKMKSSSRIISRCSHDINNMIHAILGYCELAQDESDLSEDLKDYLQEISNSAEDADRFVKRIQMFGRKKSINAMADNPMNIIKESFNLCANESNKPSKLILKQKSCDSISCDPILLQRAFCEIFTNSFDFSEKETIEITIDFDKMTIKDETNPIPLPRGNYIAIKMSDNGNGISDETAPYVFDPYFTTSETSQKGTGLAVAWSISNRHDGLLRLTNPEQSEFTLLLPADDRTPDNTYPYEKNNVIQTVTEDQTKKKKTVFLVEDNKAIRKQMTNTLKKAGFEVLSAATGEKANKIFNRKKSKISLLLLDIMLPDINGIQLSKSWEKINKEIPILFCTGYDEEYLKSKKLAPEREKTLFKPFTGTQLINRINDCVS